MAETTSLSTAGAGAPPEPWPQRQRIGLGSTGREDDVSRHRADRARDDGPGVLDQSAGLAALGVDRGGIAAEIPCRSHRLPRLLAKRSRRIPVEIDPV